MSPATVTKASPQMARISNLKNRVQELRQTRSSQLPLDFKCCSTKLQMKLCLCQQAAAAAICLVPLVIYWGCSKQQQWSRGGCWNIRGMTIWHPSCSHPCCCCGRRAWQAKEPLEAWADDVSVLLFEDSECLPTHSCRRTEEKLWILAPLNFSLFCARSLGTGSDEWRGCRRSSQLPALAGLWLMDSGHWVNNHWQSDKGCSSHRDRYDYSTNRAANIAPFRMIRSSPWWALRPRRTKKREKRKGKSRWKCPWRKILLKPTLKTM